jgi:hypothetical protein
MLSIVLAVAVLAAVIAVGVRLVQQRAVERARQGASPANAIPIRDYGEIDIALRLNTCSCGGRFLQRGETSLFEDGRSLRVAIVECRRCEREQRFFFDLSEVRH